jgi:flagellar hook-associated protein 3 FlgL
VSTRITQDTTARLLLSDLQNAADKLARSQQKIASGKEITKPSDNPVGTARALGLRSDLEDNRQYQRNVREASAWQDVTDTALNQIGDFTERARELLVQGATGSIDAEGRKAIAAEIDQIIGAVKSEANAQYAGRYVFAGAQTTTAPYSQTDNSYHGDGNGVAREIGRGVSVTVNVLGDDVIGHADGTGRTGLLGTLQQIADDLRSDNQAALGGADMQALDQAHDKLIDSRAVVGALTNRLEAASSRLGELEESNTKLLSETEDADMAKTLVDYSMQQAVYQAALKAGAQLIQPSLLDFLR